MLVWRFLFWVIWIPHTSSHPLFRLSLEIGAHGSWAQVNATQKTQKGKKTSGGVSGNTRMSLEERMEEETKEEGKGWS